MELYHVLNRGVEKRDIFMDKQDYLRFVHDLYEFNDAKPALNMGYAFKSIDLRNQYVRERERIVDIHGWCLMKNHYHLLLSEREEGGLTKFIRKLNVGYANYFNERYSRSGSLFQGRTKKKLIDSNRYFLHILHYIHLNPLDYLGGAQHWREGRVPSAVSALTQLEKYRWSSYLDYSGDHNFPSILTTKLFQGKRGEIARTTKTYLRDIEINDLQQY